LASNDTGTFVGRSEPAGLGAVVAANVFRQQLPVLQDSENPSAWAAVITYSGTSTRCDLAHATFWAFVKQQHFFQH
jgi:hypothetical protein